ncbi:MAG: hypothetical protein AAFQ68_23275 [Bacteroidota bacterium]
MTEQETLFHTVGSSIDGAVKSQLFGKPCYKINGKAFVCFFEQEMVFKLSGDDHQGALSLDGAHLFDPSRKGRPMKEWVQLAFDYQDHWSGFAEAAAAYVGG